MFATQPKIWESNLQRLLEEMRASLSDAMSETRNGEIPTVVFSVAVSGFNREGRIAELQRLRRMNFGFGRLVSPNNASGQFQCVRMVRIAQPPVPAQREEEVRQRNQGNAETLEELKRRLRGLDRTWQDGTVGSTPVFGSLD